MKRTIAGYYVSPADTRRALEELEAAGLTKDEISFVANDDAKHFGDRLRGKISPSSGTAKGAASGVLLGLAAVAIPGVGPAVAAGPLAFALIGAATGGLLGALSDMGMTRDQAQEWSDRVAQGGALLLVHTGAAKAEAAREIVARTAKHVTVHDEDSTDPLTPTEDFPNYGSDGGSSQWSQRVLRVENDEVVVAPRTISRDKSARQFDKSD